MDVSYMAECRENFCIINFCHFGQFFELEKFQRFFEPVKFHKVEGQFFGLENSRLKQLMNLHNFIIIQNMINQSKKHENC